MNSTAFFPGPGRPNAPALLPPPDPTPAQALLHTIIFARGSPARNVGARCRLRNKGGQPGASQIEPTPSSDLTCPYKKRRTVGVVPFTRHRLHAPAQGSRRSATVAPG